MSSLALFTVLIAVAAGASGATALLLRRSTRRERRAREMRPEPQRRILELDTTIEQALPKHLRRDLQAQEDEAETAGNRGMLERYLRDVRDRFGAQEAVFWAADPAGDAVPAAWAWSTPSAPGPVHFRADWASLVAWSAEARLTTVDGEAGARATLAVAPVKSGDRLLGVLSVAADSGLPGEREDLRLWVPRHATHVAVLLDLFASRREFRREMRKGQAFLEAANRIRLHTSREALAQELCEVLMEVTRGSGAAMVRWDSETNTGVVQQAMGELGVTSGFQLAADSLVSSRCMEGRPAAFEDSFPAREGELFGPGDRFAGAGSGAIVPIMRADVCFGALVVVADHPGAISHEEARNAGLLGSVAGASLEIISLADEVDRRAKIDPLTGLANRRHFEEELQRIITETDRFGKAASLVLVDIDHFKQVNDTYGHQVGDKVLRQVSRLLMSGVRTVDVCARYGGEELALILPQTSEEGACELAERLRKVIAERPVRAGDELIQVTASFGVSSYPETVKTRDGLFAAADKALYAAKHDGRNCVRSTSASRSVT